MSFASLPYAAIINLLQQPTAGMAAPQLATVLAPGLYVVPTPLGNLADITLRALHTLLHVDYVAAEDTRVTGQLLHLYGIKQKLVAYHTHNERTQTLHLLQQLQAGARIALVSDAGCPLLSDPGLPLLNACRAHNIPITFLPGGNAALMALQGSGWSEQPATLLGFIPSAAQARKQWLAQHLTNPHVLVAYEAPHRIQATLTALVTLAPTRPVLLVRELTKKFEDWQWGNAAALLAYLAHKPEAVQGEMVLVLGPAPAAALSDAEIDALLLAALATAKPRQAAAAVAKQTGQSSTALYQRLLAIKRENV